MYNILVRGECMIESRTKWQFYNNQDTPSPSSVDVTTNLSPILMEILTQRGITTEQDMQNFLSPDLLDLYDPADLSMIQKASERVHLAIERGEKILVYGDYDADGVCSTALLLKALLELGANRDFYIPNRFSEGYGPNEAAFKDAHKNGFHVIITVDTGIASVHEALIAKELGIDLIITDHHELQDNLPEAYAIINPKCSENYPFHDLAGVGVAFKFAEYLLGYFPKHLLDLVAIGTIADLVPLINENRIFAYYGLQELANTKNIGLQSLKKVCNIEGNVTEENVGFLIGPKINAVGRIKDASLAVELLMTEEEQEANKIALSIQSTNEERKQIVNKIVREAEKMVNENDPESVIVVAKEGWNEGVLGIVASRLVKKYGRPAIVLMINNETGQAKGSARSIPAFNFFNHCMRIRNLFTQFGGHSQAAGMTLPLDHVIEVQTKLNEFIKEELTKEEYKQVTEVSKTLVISDINEKLVNEINQLAPFGMSNPKPTFHFESIPTDVRQIGSNKNHLKLQFRKDDLSLEGIGFGMGDLYPHMSPHTLISIVGQIDMNEWNGIRKPQIRMQDMKIDQWQLFDHRGKKDIDISPFISSCDQNLIIRNEVSENNDNTSVHVSEITYHTSVSSIAETDTLYIYDLPPDLNTLAMIVKAAKPNNIHTLFYIKDSVYLTTFPSRDDFKWFYGFVLKRGELDLNKELDPLLDLKNWTKEHVTFIVNVFLELEFIKMDKGIVQLHPNPIKKELQESMLYQNRMNQSEIEKTLYYSTYRELKEWFNPYIVDVDTTKEEVVYGL